MKPDIRPVKEEATTDFHRYSTELSTAITSAKANWLEYGNEMLLEKKGRIS